MRSEMPGIPTENVKLIMSFLIKFLLIAISILWLLRILARFLFPWAVRKAAEKMMNGGGQQFQGSPFQQGANTRKQQHRSRQPDGKVRIDYVPPKEGERSGPQKAGEFVDFEEIK